VPVHRYRATCSWEGSTGDGYEHYRRDHVGGAPPATVTLAMSADAAFGGDAERLNPEQLVVLAASTCQLLSFLAVAARARIDVVSYLDDAEGEMPAEPAPPHLTRIVLRPRIVVRGDVSLDRVRRMVDAAHRECYVANSLRTDVTVEPAIEVRT
jgi:organic hydroperoxide reductase OsmC/OhrA